MDYAATLFAKLPAALRRDRGFERLVATLEAYLPSEQIDLIMRAYHFGAAAHEGQTRKTGEPYITHPVAVAQELANMHLDAQAITAAILHDTVEDTEASLEEISEQFGSDVAALVDGVEIFLRATVVDYPQRAGLALGSGQAAGFTNLRVFKLACRSEHEVRSGLLAARNSEAHQ